MQKINYIELEILKKFISKIVVSMNIPMYSLDYINFVFNENDLKEIIEYVDLENYDMNKGISILKDNLNKSNFIGNDDSIYINIDDYKTFFKLLAEINQLSQKFGDDSYLMNIWLRMNVSDIENVNLFLLKQIYFLKTDIFNNKSVVYGEYKGLNIMYSDLHNQSVFETDNNMSISFLKDNYRYDLPAIHYAIGVENKKLVCYIYGIQNLNDLRKDDFIKEYLRDTKKTLRNKYVSADFILALKLFIEILKSKNINIIKLPLMQVFNYHYHVSLSDNLKQAFSIYTEEDVNEFENMISNNEINDMALDYINNKYLYSRFVDKEDEISKNKTERLLDIFMIMQEKYDNIEFLNDPFIESDTLMININKEKVYKK